MEHPSFTELEIELQRKTRKSHVERLTERLDRLVLWASLLDLIRPHYASSGRCGHQPYPLEVMLRIHLLQIAYNLSDLRMEDFLHDNIPARRFAGLSLMGNTPDESTILQFRHLLEAHDLGAEILRQINESFFKAGLKLCTGRIVDASFIEAPSSTKNRRHERDPEMASGKKGNTWHFGMKMHVATDDIVGIVTNAACGPANEHDIVRARELISAETEDVYGDAGYIGLQKREEFQTGEESPDRRCLFNVRPGKLKSHPAGSILRKWERHKSSIRCKVEHVFHGCNCRWGYHKVRYRGLRKNANRINRLWKSLYATFSPNFLILSGF